ncbi:MAG: hypothetical protein FWB97_04330 [Oscillospiraceae bacterium]|nr:hypothetical protein [Oscillospiraceae bacterium]
MAPVSRAHLEGNKRYLEKLEEVKFRVPKGRKAEIKAAADSVSESLNGFVSKAVDERIARLGVLRQDSADTSSGTNASEVSADEASFSKPMFHLNGNRLYDRQCVIHRMGKDLDIMGQTLTAYAVGTEKIPSEYLNRLYDGKRILEALQECDRDEKIPGEWLDQFIIEENGK